jgi:membrane-associated phospholipid phosphatase
MAGIIAFARLKLNAHKPSEVYSGFALAFFFYILLYIVK